MKILTEEEKRLLSWLIRKEFHRLDFYEVATTELLISIADKLGFDVMAAEMRADVKTENSLTTK